MAVLNFIVDLITRSCFKVRILKGGMYMLNQIYLKVKKLLDSMLFKALLLILGIWSCHPLP